MCAPACVCARACVCMRRRLSEGEREISEALLNYVVYCCNVLCAVL